MFLACIRHDWRQYDRIVSRIAGSPSARETRRAQWFEQEGFGGFICVPQQLVVARTVVLVAVNSDIIYSVFAPKLQITLRISKPDRTGQRVHFRAYLTE